MQTDVAAMFYDWEVRQFLRRQMQDIGFYTEVAKAANGPVLELGCGTGRVTIPLAEAGLDVVGLDLSRAALQRLTAKADARTGAAGGRIEVVEADMRTFDLGRRFTVILIPYNAFQVLLTQNDQRACLDKVAAHLEPGGVVAMEITPFLYALKFKECDGKSEHLATDYFDDGQSVLSMYETVTHDFAHQLTHFDEEYRLFRHGSQVEVYRHRLTLRTVFRYEMELLLERHGFYVKALYGNYQRAPYPDPEVGSMLYLIGR